MITDYDIYNILKEILKELKEKNLNDRCKCCKCGYYRYHPFPSGTGDWKVSYGTYDDNTTGSITDCHGLEIFDTGGTACGDRCKQDK